MDFHQMLAQSCKKSAYARLREKAREDLPPAMEQKPFKLPKPKRRPAILLKPKKARQTCP